MSKTKRALPEDIDVTAPVNDVPPEQLQAEEDAARAVMQQWDAVNALQGKLWIGTVVMDFDSGATTKYSIAIASDEKPTVKHVLAALAETKHFDFENLAFLQAQGRTISAWSEPLELAQIPELKETEVPF